MISKKSTYLIVLFLIISSFITLNQKNVISILDIKTSLRVFGLSFSNNHIETLLPYIERNRDGYKKMRDYKF